MRTLYWSLYFNRSVPYQICIFPHTRSTKTRRTQLPEQGVAQVPPSQARTKQLDSCTIYYSLKAMLVFHPSLANSPWWTQESTRVEEQTRCWWDVSFLQDYLLTCHIHAVGRFYLKHKSELVLRRKHQTSAILEQKTQSYSIKGSRLPRHGSWKGRVYYHKAGVL